jgi:hypothetical protein
MSLTATLVNSVVLAGGRTLVHVRGSGFGRVRVGDVRFWVFGAFDRTVSVRATARIEARLGAARTTLTPTLVPDIDPPHVRGVDVPTPSIALVIPRPQFNIAVRLYEYVSASVNEVKRDRGEM